MCLIIIAFERVINHLASDKSEQRKGYPWRKALKKRSKETTREIANQRHARMEHAKEQCHQYRFDIPWYIAMRRGQPFADRHRKTVHCDPHGEKYDGEKTHINKLTIQHKYSYYQQHKQLNFNNYCARQHALAMKLL